MSCDISEVCPISHYFQKKIEKDLSIGLQPMDYPMARPLMQMEMKHIYPRTK